MIDGSATVSKRSTGTASLPEPMVTTLARTAFLSKPRSASNDCNTALMSSARSSRVALSRVAPDDTVTSSVVVSPPITSSASVNDWSSAI